MSLSALCRALMRAPWSSAVILVAMFSVLLAVAWELAAAIWDVLIAGNTREF